MFDGSHGEMWPRAAANDPDEVLAPAEMDPVELLHRLEARLVQSEQALQAQISRLEVRVSRLEHDVQALAGESTTDVRSLEREMTNIADRLSRLEDCAA